MQRAWIEKEEVTYLNIRADQLDVVTKLTAKYD